MVLALKITPSIIENKREIRMKACKMYVLVVQVEHIIIFSN